MIKNRIAKIAGLAVGMSLALGATSAGAQTIADLQAQINALLAQLAALQGSTTTGNVSYASCTFTRSLTLGSSGADVTCLQQYLTGTGHFNFSGGATGYFGSITKSAVAAWQAANGVAPAVGYFGPVSQARYSALAVTTTTTTTTSTTGITTPGVEGTVTVSLNPSPASGTKLYEGDDMRQVLGIKLEAKTSDIKVERIKLDLDSITNSGDNLFYTKVAEKIYVMDGSTVLASMDLNSNTVVKDGSEYYITLSGLNYVVPKDATRVLYIALGARSSWDSTYDNDSWQLSLPVDGVRGIDGAGINQYGPSSASTVVRTFTSTADLVDSATLAVSLNSSTPATQQVICEQGTDNDECDGLEVARFDFRAEKDDVTVTDFVLDIARAGATVATSSTAYIYESSTLIGSASVVGTTLNAMTATFSDIDWTVPAGSTRTLIVKFDIDDAALAADTFIASTDANDVTAENSAGTVVNASGSADGKTFTVRNVGPEVTLLSKSITTTGAPQSSATDTFSTSTLTATFNVKIKALGGDLYLGKVASTSDSTQGPLFSKTGTTNSFELYANGAISSVSNSTSTSYTIPTTCVDSTPAQTCTLAEGASVDVSVVYLIPGRTTASAAITSGLYALGLEKINWAPASTGAIQSTTFMDGLTEWRTTDVSFP